MIENTTDQIKIELNGKSTAIASTLSVSDLLAAKGLQDRLVVVELNGSIVPRSNFPTTVLAAGDKVEIVHFVGGG